MLDDRDIFQWAVHQGADYSDQGKPVMDNEFQPYQEGEPIYITIKRARGLMPSVWPGILVVVFVVFAVSGLIGHYIITPIHPDW